MQQVNPKINHIHQSTIINKTPKLDRNKTGQINKVTNLLNRSRPRKGKTKKNNEKKEPQKFPICIWKIKQKQIERLKLSANS